MSTVPIKMIRCPGCGGPSVYGQRNEYRPFCSARCKNNDFGAWASERYAVPARPDPGDDESVDIEAPPTPRPPRLNQ